MNNGNPNIVFNPLISCIQKVVLYETRTRLYLVGSNNRETRFRLLTIDRLAHNRLSIEENANEFNSLEIRRFVASLTGSPKVTSAYGVLGFVRFLEGYYLILVTKRKCCAFIGNHLVYTIKDTVMVRVNEVTSQRPPHPHEDRYKKMFQNIDLRSNFYFSYSYDLTRTLQYNESAPRFVGAKVDLDRDEPLPDWNTLTNNVAQIHERVDYAFRSDSRKRFVWNAYLLQPMEGIMLKDWLLEVIHGFVSQSCISIFGRHVNVCLIARRSTRFAGTRFLKRGANFQGDVANEVETEQIVSDGQRLCAFTQMRGSIPSHWSQDISKMVPKPQIQVVICDPYAQTPSRHFERLLFHYGAPLIMLNLVKKRERRKHESIISKELEYSIRYLNQFLPPPHRMKHIHFDMARQSRLSGGNVMEQLAIYAESVIQLTNMFFKARGSDLSLQTGIVRTNCVDCLDRTNSAQFAIGKCALGHQLERLGFLKSAKLEFDSDCVTMLEHLYEEHGDTLALQYGGSQLVHRIKTYRKTAPWGSQGNDVMQTLSRYYSNTFSDTEKQHSINLFLGIYKPSLTKLTQPIWELQTDYDMHNDFVPSTDSKQITDWVRHKVRECLPYSCADSNKLVKELFRVHSNGLEMIDAYSNYHQSFKWSDLSEHIAFEISQLAMRFMPTFRTNYSPFQRQIQTSRKARQNPSMTGQSSTGSANSNSSSSSEGDDSSSDEELSASFAEKEAKQTESAEPAAITLDSVLPSMEQVYGCSINPPSKQSMAIYKKYVQMGKLSSGGARPAQTSVAQRDQELAKIMRGITMRPLSNYGQDSYLSVRPPTVPSKSQNIYVEYCKTPRNFNSVPKFEEFDVLYRYVQKL
ncbi:polyphosphoinositide phosphatase [Drosophila obscura]|uniref:polyphosphoinositide phosphatase n=1 Tax=Drosophila obscura TaxID=7282 RepID=UPI001BB1E6C6|nr:polyphosphoinositide phosphatase [Drosophila obscura]XP_022231455.2 polyphosphoinositide phosphatase [Drosophila obscura]XP_022231456.2 polyphosphoinositide phosphatase [Drosophila obscura]XP_041449693.1 polyphosphoinositide phosphatase [Drosophila obscura]